MGFSCIGKYTIVPWILWVILPECDYPSWNFCFKSIQAETQMRVAAENRPFSPQKEIHLKQLHWQGFLCFLLLVYRRVYPPRTKSQKNNKNPGDPITLCQMMIRVYDYRNARYLGSISTIPSFGEPGSQGKGIKLHKNTLRFNHFFGSFPVD